MVNRPCWFQVPILLATLISASWQASSASGGVGQHAAADVEGARPDRGEQQLHGVAVAVLGAPRQVVDLVRRVAVSLTMSSNLPSDCECNAALVNTDQIDTEPIPDPATPQLARIVSSVT